MEKRFTELSSFSPSDMASALLRLHGVSAVADPKTEVAQTESELVEGPFAGKRVEVDGRMYEFAKAPTYKMVFNRETGKLEPGYHSLRTHFSHSTEDIGPGAGWDVRLDLLSLTEDQQMERYGHVFTREEVFSPSGRPDPESFGGPLLGGMPDDILYYDLVLVDEQAQQS